LVLLLILSFTATALAQPGKYAQLGKGQMMPWSGWCFDSEAMAHILAEREGQEARCRIKLQRQAEELEGFSFSCVVCVHLVHLA